MSQHSTAAVKAASTPQRTLRVIPGGRGRPDRVTQRTSDALAPIIEGIALADEAIAASERIYMALSADRPDVALHEAGRLGVRAGLVRCDLRTMAGAVERRPRGAA
ncbi:MAG TPA: hypothetical protein VFW92_06085 [Candidatus Limnocylindrales bacterium]|nr:hypothetical protein [Candidatus Limnocylindrales bacterium]